jgi:STE24 endopeptidase
MSFDPRTATAAYVDSLGPEALARAHAYTIGGHWLLLWGVVVGAIVAALIVRSGVLERVDRRLARRGWRLRAFVVGVVYFLVAAALSTPWMLYESWWRERAYGRTAQPLGDFLGQALLSTAISSVLAASFFVGVYALMRRTGRRWWLWSGALTAAAFAATLLVWPVFVEPLFNRYEPVPPGDVRAALVPLARQAGVPEDRIFVFDGSRQSNNFTANVSGLGRSARIAISDVAFKGASLDEVKAVTGHEIGHYVLGHVWRMVLTLSLLAVVAFYAVDRSYPWFARRFGSRASLDSPTGLPVLLFMVSVVALLAQPVMNAVIRAGETAADRYSLETVNLPDAMASALVKTAEYRYPRPTRLQEVLFYSHPSVERRVLAAMEWKAAHDAATAQ